MFKFFLYILFNFLDPETDVELEKSEKYLNGYTELKGAHHFDIQKPGTRTKHYIQVDTIVTIV